MNRARFAPLRSLPLWTIALTLAALGACADDGTILDTTESVEGYEDEVLDENWASAPSSTETFDKALETVGQLASARTCSTGPTTPLNIQIAEEMACMEPSRFASVADIRNVRLGAGANPFMQGNAAAALRRAAAANPNATFEINSSWRSVVQQYVLKRWEGSCGISIAASPGRSNHESGLAIDVPSATTNAFAGALRREGFVWYCDRTNGGRASGCGDVPHWEFSGTDLRTLGIKAFQRLWNRAHPTDRISEDGIYGNQTAARIAQAPLGGFSTGTSCGQRLDDTTEPQQPVDDPQQPAPSGEEVALDQLSKDVQGLATGRDTLVWHTSLTARACAAATKDEDFSSGRYNAHRYATTISPDGPVRVRLANTRGTWTPAIFVFDSTGDLVYGGDASGAHPTISAELVQDGRDGRAAELTLSSTSFQHIAVFVTGWNVIDAGMGARITTQARYNLGLTQSCTAPSTGTGALSSFYAGLSLDGMEVPRAGLSNSTLNQVHGVSTETTGDTVSHDGLQFVRGKVSWFGGPNDTGVSSTETGSITSERLRSLNSPLNPSASQLQSNARSYYYIAMRWNYSPRGREWWANARLLVVNPANGRAVVVRPVDWGPNIRTGRIMDLSPQVLTDLGLSTDQNAVVSFAPLNAPLGRVQ